MKISSEAKQIVKNLYKLYNSDAGISFDTAPTVRSVVEMIVQFTLDEVFANPSDPDGTIVNLPNLCVSLKNDLK